MRSVEVMRIKGNKGVWFVLFCVKMTAITDS
jgi:hypothetical protein